MTIRANGPSEAQIGGEWSPPPVNRWKSGSKHDPIPGETERWLSSGLVRLELRPDGFERLPSR